MTKYETAIFVEIDIIGASNFHYRKFKYQLIFEKNKDSRLSKIYMSEVLNEEKFILEGSHQRSRYNNNILNIELVNHRGNVKWIFTALEIEDELISNIAHFLDEDLLKHSNMIFTKVDRLSM